MILRLLFLLSKSAVKSVFISGEYTLYFDVDINKIKEKAKYMMLAVQGFVCGAPDFCIWNTAKVKGKAKVE